MKTITMQMFVYFNKYHWESEGSYTAYSFKTPDTESLTFVCQKAVEFKVPANYDSTAQKIAALEAERTKVRIEFNALVANINDRITKLQALEFTK
jgi:hypothetical protein